MKFYPLWLISRDKSEDEHSFVYITETNQLLKILGERWGVCELGTMFHGLTIAVSVLCSTGLLFLEASAKT